MLGVVGASGDASGEFDETIHSFGAAVVSAIGGEVGQERISPSIQGAAESCEFWDLNCPRFCAAAIWGMAPWVAAG